MIKLLIGGSPCTYWSIAQKNGRETKAEGMGWELFKNYLIAKEKFKPDFFLYENNKSAAQAIKDQIKEELGVWDGTLFMEDTGARYIEINSALVSAQNRQRFYVHNCGEVEQPEDRGILLRDILESGAVDREKAYALVASHQGNARDYFKKNHAQVAFEPQRIPEYGMADKARPVTASYANKGCGEGSLQSECFPDNPSKQVRDFIAEPVPVNTTADGKSYAIKANTGFGPANYLKGGGHYPASAVAEPIRIGDVGSNSQAHRVYSCDGKSVTINAGGGGQGGKTGLYACPIENLTPFVEKKLPDLVDKYGDIPEHFNPYNTAEIGEKTPTMTTCCGSQTSSATVMSALPNDGKVNGKPVYEVKDGLITIKGKKYPIKLADGYYIIRKLTVTECCRLQTMPDNYCRAVSNAQAYKGLGNGWTAEVIIHILSGALKNVPRDEEIVVLSMYDGIGTGRYCLDKMGFTNVKYFAYEIDKYAKQISMSNYPDIVQMGDAFNLRHPDWTIGY